MSKMVEEIKEQMKKISDPIRAKQSHKFFKTAKGQYGEGDFFRGIPVPKQRKISKLYKHITIAEAFELLQSQYHEDRLTALFIIVLKFNKVNDNERKYIYELYLKNTNKINNWDLVDSSAHQIIGGYLLNKNRSQLYKFAKSLLIWERRISIIATYHFIKKDDFADTLSISEILLNDKEDLIHKAVGWMIREVGNRNFELGNEFLKNHYKYMPRTMLRYAIEKFPEKLRKSYLKSKV